MSGHGFPLLGTRADLNLRAKAAGAGAGEPIASQQLYGNKDIKICLCQNIIIY
jgi:hypothetical protein